MASTPHRHPENERQDEPAAPGAMPKTDITGRMQQVSDVTKVAMEIAKPAEQNEYLRLRDVKFLQIEDERPIAMMSAAFLSRIGIAGETAGSLEEGLQKLENAAKAGTRISLIILDQKFPQEQSGDAAENFMRGMKNLQATYPDALKNLRAVVFFTGSGQEQDRANLQIIAPECTILLLRKPPLPASMLNVSVLEALKLSRTVDPNEADKLIAEIKDAK